MNRLTVPHSGFSSRLAGNDSQTATNSADALVSFGKSMQVHGYRRELSAEYGAGPSPIARNPTNLCLIPIDLFVLL